MSSYTAKDITVLEGLEPVRAGRLPGEHSTIRFRSIGYYFAAGVSCPACADRGGPIAAAPASTSSRSPLGSAAISFTRRRTSADPAFLRQQRAKRRYLARVQRDRRDARVVGAGVADAGEPAVVTREPGFAGLRDS